MSEIAYTIVLPCLKISILLFYLRVFPIQKLRIGVVILAAASIAWGIAFFFVTIFTCTPPHYIWDVNRAEYAKHCLPSSANRVIPIVIASTNILTDLLIIALPIPLIWNLQLSKRRLIGLRALFLLGIL